MSAASPGGHAPCYFPPCGRSRRRRAEMTFLGTLGTDPSGPRGRKEGSSQGQACLPDTHAIGVALDYGVPPAAAPPPRPGSGEPRVSLEPPMSARPPAPWWDLSVSGNLAAPRPNAPSSWRRRSAGLPLPVPPPCKSRVPAKGQRVGGAGAPAVGPRQQCQGRPEKQR